VRRPAGRRADRDGRRSGVVGGPAALRRRPAPRRAARGLALAGSPARRTRLALARTRAVSARPRRSARPTRAGVGRCRRGRAAWQRDPAGVWKDGAKLAACGIHVARGVSVHGFALDVATPREAWARINPCGLDKPLVSLSALRGAPIGVADVAVEVGPRVVTA